MPTATRFGDVPLIADSTVWGKLRIAPPGAQQDFLEAARNGLIVGSPVVWLEVVYHAHNKDEFDERVARFGALPMLRVTEPICNSAMAAVEALGEHPSPGYHRVKAPDALIAATAAANGVNVLHDDKHYNKLAEVLDFEPIRFGPYH
jgi:predicted nucleic acid-binding protein